MSLGSVRYRGEGAAFLMASLGSGLSLPPPLRQLSDIHMGPSQHWTCGEFKFGSCPLCATSLQAAITPEGDGSLLPRARLPAICFAFPDSTRAKLDLSMGSWRCPVIGALGSNRVVFAL